MSRTKGHNGNQRPSDLWSRRPCAGMAKDKFSRKLTVRKERAASRRTILDELGSDAATRKFEEDGKGYFIFDDEDDNPIYDCDYLMEGLPTKWNSTMDFSRIEQDAEKVWDNYWSVTLEGV